MKKFKPRWKSGFRKDVGIFCRSSSEYLYAKYLNELLFNGKITKWDYEKENFEFPVKHGTTQYKIDFRVWRDPWSKPEIHEVKGFLDPQSKTRIKRLKKYYPEAFERFFLIEESFIKYLRGKYSITIDVSNPTLAKKEKKHG